MHDTIVAQVLVRDPLLIVGATIQPAAGNLPAGRQDLGERQVLQAAVPGVGHGDFGNKILPLGQAGRVHRFALCQEAGGQAESVTAGLFVPRQRRAGVAQGDKQFAFTVVADTKGLGGFAIGQRLAVNRRGGRDVLPALLAFTHRKLIALLIALTARVARHGISDQAVVWVLYQ